MGTWISADSGSCGFFGSQERESADQGKIQEDIRQMFLVASGVTAAQEGTCRISRAGIIPEQFPDLERMRAMDYLLLPLLTQGYERKQAWEQIKPVVKASTLWEKRMIYVKNLTAYEKSFY